MIRGSWDMLHLFCGCHGELKELEIEASSRGVFYVCKEKKGNIPCMTKLRAEDYEEILSHFSDLIVQAEVNGEVINLAHTVWSTKKKITCRVLLHKKDRIHIMVDCAQRRR